MKTLITALILLVAPLPAQAEEASLRTPFTTQSGNVGAADTHPGDDDDDDEDDEED
jgi:hypothetical protein